MIETMERNNIMELSQEFFEELYNTGGQRAIMVLGAQLGLRFDACEPCDIETPTHDATCTVCGTVK